MAVLVLVIAGLVGCEKSQTPEVLKSVNETYPGAWQEAFNAELSIALAHNKVSGCGQFKYREHYQGNEFLVYCTSDGSNWTGYIVFPVIDKVIGPLQPDPSLN